jgi:hypothetical protein
MITFDKSYDLPVFAGLCYWWNPNFVLILHCYIIVVEVVVVLLVFIIIIISIRDTQIMVTTSPGPLNFVLWRLLFVVSHFGTGAKNCKVASTLLEYMWTRYYDDMEATDVSNTVMLTCS